MAMSERGVLSDVLRPAAVGRSARKGDEAGLQRLRLRGKRVAGWRRGRGDVVSLLVGTRSRRWDESSLVQQETEDG